MQPDHARHRQTNRIIERFNGCAREVLATHRFKAGQYLAQMLEQPYSPQQRLQHQTSISGDEAVKEQHAGVFKKTTF